MTRFQYRLLCACCWLPFRRALASWVMGRRCETFVVTGKGVVVVFEGGWSTMLHGLGDWRRM